jgi:exonuclease III
MKTSVDEIKELCDNNDIVLLQEIRLTEQDIPMLSQVSTEFYYKATTAMNTQNGLILGSPYEGIAIMWRKTLGPSVKAVDYCDSRVLGLEVIAANAKLLILNTYLPCSSSDHLDEFMFYLCKLDNIISTADTHLCMIMGDLNADLKRDPDDNITHLFGRNLLSYCQNEGLIISDYIMLDKSTSTFFSTVTGKTSWLDHVICTSSMHSLVDSVEVKQDFVSSDHLPISVSLNLDHARVKLDHDTGTSQTHIKWDTLTKNELANYTSQTKRKLAEIQINHELMLCYDSNCTDAGHVCAIDRLYNGIVEALLSAGETVERTRCSSSHQVAGWNLYCKELHTMARDAFLDWRHQGSPRAGAVFKVMQQTRAQFKRLIRQCKGQEDKKVADAMAAKLLSKNSKEFWKLVKKMNNNKVMVQATTINGATGSEDICNMWKEHYCELLNTSKDYSKQESVQTAITGVEPDARCDIEVKDIIKAIKDLKTGKAKGLDGVTSEHIKYAMKALLST